MTKFNKKIHDDQVDLFMKCVIKCVNVPIEDYDQKKVRECADECRSSSFKFSDFTEENEPHINHEFF